MKASQRHASHFVDLKQIARHVLKSRGFVPDFSPEVRAQLKEIEKHPPAVASGGEVKDLRHLLWTSIDNDTSRDIDQIEVAGRLSNGDCKVWVGVADVDASVPKNSPIDAHAYAQTATIYAGVESFPMLPEGLCYGVTSLLENADRLAIIIECTVHRDGTLLSSDIYHALVRNRAQLAYNAVGAWLAGSAPAPEKIAGSEELQAQLRLQDEVAQLLKHKRYEHGALYLETIELRPVFEDTKIVDMVNQEKNHATELVEDFMIAANGAVARFLKEVSSLRRIVRVSERWDQIVKLAAVRGATLPSEPSSSALNAFLIAQKAADPDRFADLSLSVIKLIGRGEYILERPADESEGHFGLGVDSYTHSTAPNRRFVDLVTHRILKAVLRHQEAPYGDEELRAIAANCTEKEVAADKVERDMVKRIAAMVMGHRVGEEFDALVTGVTASGTFVRVLHPHVEGMLMKPPAHLDVGDTLRVRLIHTNIARGFIDFAAVSS